MTLRSTRICLLHALMVLVVFAASTLAHRLAWGDETGAAVELRYSADSGKEPSDTPQSAFVPSSTGVGKFEGGALHTTDSSPDGDGRYYYLPPQAVPLDSSTEIKLTVNVSVLVSTGSRTATAVELRLKGDALRLGPLTKGAHGEGYQDVIFEDRQIALAWVSDGKHHEQDEVLLIDAARPGDEGILGRRRLRVDQPHRYTLEVRRARPGGADDFVVLSVDLPSVEPIILPLKDFKTQTDGASFSLIFGHPAGPGLGEADWRDLTLRVTPAASQGNTRRDDATVHNIGRRRQLFLDDLLIARREHLERVQGQPEKWKGNPVLKREKPWEVSRCELYGSAIWNPERDRLEMFYSATRQPYDAKLALAVSSDQGQSWTRPALDVFPWEGQPSNIVWPGRYWTHGPCVLFDPHDKDASRRYKLFLTAAPLDPTKVNEGPKGIDAAFSPDGIHWTASKGNPVIAGFNSDTGNSVIWDAERKLYRAYVRMRCNVGRSAAVSESPDFLNWSEPRTVYIPTAGDATRKWEFYGLSVTPYEGMYVGLVWIFPAVPASADPNSDTPVTWPELVVSRDGEHWQRPFFGEAFLPLGPKGSFDHRQIRPASSFTLLPDRVVLMYSGSPDPHVSGHKWDIGMATVRPDGFAAMRATDTEGSLLTAPLSFKAGTLYINAAVENGGYVKAELLDVAGKVVPGYDLSACQAFTGDHVHAPLTWSAQRTLATAMPSGARIRFVLKNARLYSFQVVQ